MSQADETGQATTTYARVLERQRRQVGRAFPLPIGALAAAMAAWFAAAIWAGYGAPVGMFAVALVVLGLTRATGVLLEPLSILLALIPAAALPMTGLISAGTTYVPIGVMGAALFLYEARHGQPYRRDGLPPRLVLGVVAGFLLWSAVAAIASDWRATGAVYIAGMAATLTICFVVAPSMAWRFPNARRAALETVALVGVISGAFDIVFYLAGPIAPFNREIGRYLLMEVVLGGVRTGLVLPWATGPFLSPAAASAILVPALLALLALRSDADKHASHLVIAGIAFVAVALTLTWTRTGWLAACAGLAVMTLAGLASGHLDRYAAALLVVFSLLMVGVMLGPLGADLRTDLDQQRYGSADTVRGIPTPSAPTAQGGSSGPSSLSGGAPTPVGGSSPGGTLEVSPDQLPEVRGGSSLSGRLSLWAASVSAVRARPITGWGPGTNPEAIAPFLGDGGSSYGGLTSHSTWFRTAVETGIPGLLLVGAYILSVLGVCARAFLNRRSPPDAVNRGLLAIFISLLGWATFESTILGGVAYPAFLWALTGALLTSSLAPQLRPSAQEREVTEVPQDAATTGIRAT